MADGGKETPQPEPPPPERDPDVIRKLIKVLGGKVPEPKPTPPPPSAPPKP